MAPGKLHSVPVISSPCFPDQSHGQSSTPSTAPPTFLPYLHRRRLVLPQPVSLRWKGACFYNNTAWMVFPQRELLPLWRRHSPHQGSTSSAHSWTCIDLYIFATPYRVTWDYYFLALFYLLMQSGMIGTLRALWDVFPLFANSGWGENKRLQPWVSNINVDDIHSGDFLAISKIRGRWGGFETMEKWATGSFAGHTAVFLRDSEGKLWVAESGHDNEKKHDRETLWLPYNMIFSWIDTRHGNYLPPLDAHGSDAMQVASFMTMWNKMQPNYTDLWNEALNKRLGTKQDDWVYADGKSASCVSFILEMYKQASLFHPISDSYTSYRVHSSFCQITGKYRMELPYYNALLPYPHMNERCPSLPPKYIRPDGC
ncbi:hypothetical protein J5N97_000196 [Dioscorea zingiberensis]|uniref:Uncharacterized protein n=1 Tax=Dioscorea zingiberensis TaxID=325984 RepID=A0A9D5BSK3_9LILI|nr:hypothetical protein J5N97_000196 [Dioscorea zingiberensis]